MSTNISKFLSSILRHAPETIGLTLDAQGWADVSELLAKANAFGTVIDEPTLKQVVNSNDKKRFTLSDDGKRIRAAQGHSVVVELGNQAIEPPLQLFHGTATRFLDSILQNGLLPGSRQQVHLSADVDTATQVGQRHGKPVILLVAAGKMHSDGYAFFQADNGVWLTDSVPPVYLLVDDKSSAEDHHA